MPRVTLPKEAKKKIHNQSNPELVRTIRQLKKYITIVKLTGGTTSDSSEADLLVEAEQEAARRHIHITPPEKVK